MKEQKQVETFLAEQHLHAPPEMRVADLTAEVGELAKAVVESTGYGDHPEPLDVPPDELGDALFALLALASELEIDAADALAAAMEKYSERIDATGSPSSAGDSTRSG